MIQFASRRCVGTFSRPELVDLYQLTAQRGIPGLPRSRDVRNSCADLTFQMGGILTHSHRMALVLAAVSFLLNNLREERSEPLTSQKLHVLNLLAIRCLKIASLCTGKLRSVPRGAEEARFAYPEALGAGEGGCRGGGEEEA